MDEITVAEAAEIVGYGVRGINMAIQQGRLPARRIGKLMWLLKRADVEQFARERKPGIGRPRAMRHDEQVAD